VVWGGGGGVERCACGRTRAVGYSLHRCRGEKWLRFLVPFPRIRFRIRVRCVSTRPPQIISHPARAGHAPGLAESMWAGRRAAQRCSGMKSRGGGPTQQMPLELLRWTLFHIHTNMHSLTHSLTLSLSDTHHHSHSGRPGGTPMRLLPFFQSCARHL